MWVLGTNFTVTKVVQQNITIFTANKLVHIAFESKIFAFRSQVNCSENLSTSFNVCACLFAHTVHRTTNFITPQFFDPNHYITLSHSEILSTHVMNGDTVLSLVRGDTRQLTYSIRSLQAVIWFLNGVSGSHIRKLMGWTSRTKKWDHI